MWSFCSSTAAAVVTADMMSPTKNVCFDTIAPEGARILGEFRCVQIFLYTSQFPDFLSLTQALNCGEKSSGNAGKYMLPGM